MESLGRVEIGINTSAGLQISFADWIFGRDFELPVLVCANCAMDSTTKIMSKFCGIIGTLLTFLRSIACHQTITENASICLGKIEHQTNANCIKQICHKLYDVLCIIDDL